MAEAAIELRADLPDDQLGYYDQARHVIVLSLAQTDAERRCTEAHERIHAERRDGGVADPWFDTHYERTVDREAARRLISLDDLMDALVWCHDLDEVAEELFVDMDTLLNRIDCLDQEDRQIISSRLHDQGRGIA